MSAMKKRIPAIFSVEWDMLAISFGWEDKTFRLFSAAGWWWFNAYISGGEYYGGDVFVEFYSVWKLD